MKKVFILGLSLLAFAACKNAQNGAAGDGAQAATRVDAAYDIAYIRMDSLVNNYDRFIDLSAAFEAKVTKAQGDLEARARRLETEVLDFQNKAQRGLATSSQLAALQEELQGKSVSLDNDRQTKMGELAEEEQVMTNQVLNAIQEYVAKYNADYRYKMILTTTGGTPILHADPALDITAEILEGLNSEYVPETAGE